MSDGDGGVEAGVGEFFLSEDDIVKLYEQEYLENMGDPNPLKMCTEGVLGSLPTQIFRLVMLSLIQRMISMTSFPSFIKHLGIVVCGLYALTDNITDDDLLTTVILGSVSLLFAIVFVPVGSKGTTVTTIAVASILTCEYFLTPALASSIRGILMILAMKLSSLAFDFEANPSYSFLSGLSYLFSPATVVFGPFTTIDDHEKSLSRRSLKDEVCSSLRGLLCLIAAIVCVLYSSCVTDTFAIGGLLSDYATAQSFRFSHYFICFLAQGLFHLSGGSGWVTLPMSMELPRSLVDVVIAWNIPMHNYLRKYIYRKSVHLGGLAAILYTFAVSSMLHGLNFQLSAVLLTLGFHCYAENRLRDRLSLRLSACVRARACHKCNHTSKQNSPLALLVNLSFLLVSVYHLIYLGMPFDSSSAETGYDWRHTRDVWSHHYYASHVICLITYLISTVL